MIDCLIGCLIDCLIDCLGRIRFSHIYNRDNVSNDLLMPINQLCGLICIVIDQMEISHNGIIFEGDLKVVAQWEHSVPVVNDVNNDEGGLVLDVERVYHLVELWFVLCCGLQGGKVGEGSVFFKRRVECGREVRMAHVNLLHSGWNHNVVVSSDDNCCRVDDPDSDCVVDVDGGCSQLDCLDLDDWGLCDELGLLELGFLLNDHLNDLLDFFRKSLSKRVHVNLPDLSINLHRLLKRLLLDQLAHVVGRVSGGGRGSFSGDGRGGCCVGGRIGRCCRVGLS